MITPLVQILGQWTITHCVQTSLTWMLTLVAQTPLLENRHWDTWPIMSSRCTPCQANKVKANVDAVAKKDKLAESNVSQVSSKASMPPRWLQDLFALRWLCPYLLKFSPVRGPWSPWQHINMSKSTDTRAKVLEDRKKWIPVVKWICGHARARLKRGCQVLVEKVCSFNDLENHRDGQAPES
jgi:hypothetical protein